MYWVLASFPALKCPVRINSAFNKKDQLFVNPCLKIGFDLLPADHPHKRDFYEFMIEVQGKEFQAQAKEHIEELTTRQNMTTVYKEEGYRHYVGCFSRCSGTIAHYQWSNLWLLGKIGDAPQFAGWDAVCLDKLVMDYLRSKNPGLEDDEMEEDY